jgi:uncharacterized membrane protein (DUF106 family)
MRAKGNQMMNLLSSLASADLSSLQQPPLATILILLMSVAVNVVFGFMGRRSMDIDEYRRITIESRIAQQEVMAAMKSGNQRRISKAQKRQQELSQEQMKISGNRMKASFFFLIPLMILWPILGRFFGDTIIAYMPFKSPFSGLELKMFNWYFLCSITTSIITQRVLGLTFEYGPEDRDE